MNFASFPWPARIIIYILLLALLTTVIFPFVWMVLTSVKTQQDFIASPFGLPSHFEIGNFVVAWRSANFLRLYANSLFITCTAVTGIVLSCSAAGYAFAHFKFRGSGFLFLYFLAGMMIPPQAILIPSFVIMSKLGLVNTYLSAIFTYFSWIPFGLLFFRAYFMGIPKELAEAARMDGASEISIFFKIMFPLARPAVATVSIIYFLWIFNDFMWPLVYLNDENLRTVTLGMMNFQGKYSSLVTLKTAALTLAMLPPLLVFIGFRRQIQGGLMEGALKR